MRERIEKLEAEKVRLYYKIARLEFNEKDWEDFDPSEYTVPFADMLDDMKKLLRESTGAKDG